MPLNAPLRNPTPCSPLDFSRPAVRAWVRVLALAAAVMIPPGVASGQDSTTAKPAAPGIYSDEQAERGNGVFSKVCLECHTQNDMSGKDFRLNWHGRTVFDLFDRIRTTMPEAAPGSLTHQEYTDVTAYILKLNGMPTGTTAMPGDSTLTSVKLDIPAPPAQFVLVHRVLRSTHSSRPSGMHARTPSSASLRADQSLLFRGF